MSFTQRIAAHMTRQRTKDLAEIDERIAATKAILADLQSERNLLLFDLPSPEPVEGPSPEPAAEETGLDVQHSTLNIQRPTAGAGAGAGEAFTPASDDAYARTLDVFDEPIESGVERGVNDQAAALRALARESRESRRAQG